MTKEAALRRCFKIDFNLIQAPLNKSLGLMICGDAASGQTKVSE